MNERIKELAIKSKLICDNGIPRYCGEFNDIDAFVELIIKECIEIAEDWETYRSYLTDRELSRTKKVSQKLKQHFGVE